jgi:hypothetical protein
MFWYLVQLPISLNSFEEIALFFFTKKIKNIFSEEVVLHKSPYFFANLLSAEIGITAKAEGVFDYRWLKPTVIKYFSHRLQSMVINFLRKSAFFFLYCALGE